MSLTKDIFQAVVAGDQMQTDDWCGRRWTPASRLRTCWARA